MTGMILILNRCLELVNKDLAKNLFEGNRTLVWIMAPTLYMFYETFFTKPFLFNARLEALFVNPYGGIPEIIVDNLEVSI